MSAALLGDLAVTGGLSAGLLDARVQTEIGHQPLGRREPPEVTDRRDQRQRDGCVDAGDGDQPQDLFALQRDPSQSGVDDPQLLGVKVDLTQQRVDRELLIGRQVLITKPAAALDPEQVRRRATWDQVALKDRLHLILQAGALPHDVRASGDLTAHA